MSPAPPASASDASASGAAGSGPHTAAGLADALVAFTVRKLEALVAHQLPGFRVPRVLAGHRVGEDARADLLFTLGMLHDLGVAQVSGVAVEEALRQVLCGVDGAGTHTFFSYRVAETLRRFGAFEGNPLLHGLDGAVRDEVALATDSSGWLPLLDKGLLPRNYAAVLARCESARQALGLPVDGTRLEALIEGTRAILTENPLGALDDSNTRIARYDIYSADFALFTEPLRQALGADWERGMESALELVRHGFARNGAAITWGRSTGVLALCLSLELSGVAVARGAEDADRWLARAALALDGLDDWFEDGLSSAHAHRSPYAYRGPKRRLQLTLDVLGKLTDAALHLRRAPDPTLQACSREALLAPTDRLVRLGESDGACLWSLRTRDMALVLPLVGATVSDYLPAPRNPGLFEVPVDSDCASFVPVAWRGDKPFTSGLPPAEVAHEAGQAALSARWERFVPAGLLEWPKDAEPLAGTREARFSVTGRRLEVSETLSFPPDALPDALSLQVPEALGRPLDVRFECDAEHAIGCVPTHGLAEARSFWSELPRVHQIDITPAPSVQLRWSVSPRLRVAVTDYEGAYNRCLYDALGDRVVETRFPYVRPAQLEGLPERLRHVDVLHVHWPEWVGPRDLELHRALLDCLRAADVRVLWTQHNARPHMEHEHNDAIYALWASRVDAIVHHSEWGRAEMYRRLAYRPDVIEATIPHGHWGSLSQGVARIPRAEAEAALGLAPCAMRLGVVGAPRPGKETQAVMNAFAACHRDDLQLLVTSLGPGESAPEDPRIRAFPYEHVPREVFDQRLAAIDVLVLPYRAGHQLTTGVFADAVGLGLPCIVSDWAFLREMLGEAGIVYGQGEDDLRACLASLDRQAVARAAAASRALQPRFDWGHIADQTLALLDTLGTAKL